MSVSADKARQELLDALDHLLLVTPKDLQSCLQTIVIADAVENTAAQFHCHFVTMDGNSVPMVSDLASMIADKILDYSIQRKRIATAKAILQTTGSSSAIVRLSREARRLFVPSDTSGEAGEILLYLLIEAYLKSPQVLCKMSLKTNNNVHFHGIDGLHATVDPKTKHLVLYWGEAKIHGDVHKAVTDALKGLGSFLLDAGGTASRQTRDLLLLRDFIDLNDPILEDALLKYLDPDQPAYFRQYECRAACLIGFDCEHYPSQPHTKDVAGLRNDIQNSVAKWKKSIHDKIHTHQLHSFIIHLFFIPFPSVDEFRAAFLKEIGING
ncbi:MAG: DUF1837 domain-containing protein [Phycisphaerae bacterium]|jgi:hypothetical protein